MLNLRKATFFKLLDIILNDDNTLYQVWYNHKQIDCDNIPIVDIIHHSYKNMHYESGSNQESFYYSHWEGNEYRFEIFIHITDFVYINVYMYDI